MPTQTPFEYYGDEENYGSGQWVTLDEVIDGIITEAALDEDHYLKNTKRATLLRNAKMAIREVTGHVGRQNLQFAITVPSHLTWPLPQDYVRYKSVLLIRLDEKTSSYRLVPLDVSSDINTAIDYLQDENGDLLFDEDGQILMGDVVNAIGQPYKRYSFCEYDASKPSANGEVVIDEERGIMAFSSDLAEKNIVIRYQSDGLSDTTIRVHKDMRTAIENYIYFLSIHRKRNVSETAIRRAERAYNGALHRAKIKAARIDLLQIARILRANPIP